MPKRPSPEKLLQQIQEEERHDLRGKFKIYLGAAPGVGKTYTMLQDALSKRAQGLDVVVGIVETHSRKEIEKLLKDLEVLPRQQVEYREQKIKEFDLDAALKRHPGLILMDEMAHTNVPGLRHAKRWQDIKELLDRGIDVYTTLNVQHIESLNDVIAQIIHTHINETVPDFMLEMADTIELVDLAPEDLLKRLKEGKVYFPKQAEIAADHFFRKGNLTALRELALRETAERVNAQVLLYRQGQGIKHVWPTKEKILVCVGYGTEATKLIRSAKRISAKLQAQWMAVYVNTPRIQRSDEQFNHAIQNLRLAEQLGAETRILTGFDIVKEIMNFAREQNCTQIVIGKHPRSRLKILLSGSLADEIIRCSGEIDVYVITDEPVKIKRSSAIPTIRVPPWRALSVSVVMVTIATIVNLLGYPYFGITNTIMIYLLGIIFVALYGEMQASLFISILSIIVYDFFFVPPFYTFTLPDLRTALTLIGMFVVGQVISHLAILSRRQAEVASLSEQYTATLHTLSRHLASTRGVDKLLETAVGYIGEAFNSEVVALLPENNHLESRASYQTELALNAKEQAVAQWVYDLGQAAGLGTDTLPFSDAVYVPLMGSQGPMGVLRIRSLQRKHWLSPQEMNLLEASANQVGLAIEVDRLQEQSKKSELLVETDRVRSALLQSVAHDLRTPLVAVMGAASTLMEMGHDLDRQTIKNLATEIYKELEQLSRLINNLLQMTYLEAESVQLEIEPHSLPEAVNTALKTLEKKLENKPVNIKLPDELRDVPFDSTLIQEVFINLMDNAIKFTLPNTPIDIVISIEGNHVLISVEDRGPGIVDDEVGHLFEKFYRGRMLTSERGLGLGLAICHSIIKAHGGEIWAENRPEGGAAFRFTLLMA